MLFISVECQINTNKDVWPQAGLKALLDRLRLTSRLLFASDLDEDYT
jgi:hypothetical protein